MNSYDYVIVGAGSAGCVLAARLSEDPACRVLLLEAGGRDRSFNIHMPAGSKAFHSGPNPHNWFDFTEPQPGLAGRPMYWPSGRGWGGTSSINGMAHVRGHPRDYDGWAALGLDSWSYDAVLRYFIRTETNQRGASPWHGGDGPLHVSDSPELLPLSAAFLAAGVAAGYPETSDFNGSEPEGFGRLQMAMHEGRRCSAATAYLHPALNRPNLAVVSHALVTRVLFEEKRASGVEWRRGGRLERAVAVREVILCAGVTRSPQVLMLSGIGDAGHLRDLGIPVTVDRPQVGQNLQDHVNIQLKWTCPRPVTLYSATTWPGMLLAGLRYLLFRTGPAAGMGVEVNGFVRSAPDVAYPDLQIALMNALMEGGGIDKLKILRHGFSLSAWHLRPGSRGRISLRSNDPADAPIIQPNYLTSPVEAVALRRAVRIVREVIGQAGFDGYRGDEIAPGAAIVSDEEIDDFIRHNATGLFHPVGTARMGVDADSVVDESLRVRGVEGLRVADASIMPRIVSGNTNAAVMMIAEKAADLVRSRSF